ncbi:hypothetical protein [Argonema antarcticum]|uniref:hypothetical protein n=1 Tax=Argonema antarcticum TaxID=2942763 RepID=UPI00201225C4|nr:hypothetical protein [Argonema antarcticum]MCL1475780.1 hypothetical protein [Argonema antarcticum A004/B2]
MKLRTMAWATVCTLLFSLSLSFAAGSDEAEQPCQASLDTSNGSDNEENNCPITVGKFSIRGTFSNSNWQASFWAWEPAYYILYVKNQQDGSTINLTGFKVTGTTSRPQYRFTDPDRDVTYIVTFRYSDSDTIRLEIYQKDRASVNELLARESDKLIGGP